MNRYPALRPISKFLMVFGAVVGSWSVVIGLVAALGVWYDSTAVIGVAILIGTWMGAAVFILMIWTANKLIDSLLDIEEKSRQDNYH